jgi:hypothetical protein
MFAVKAEDIELNKIMQLPTGIPMNMPCLEIEEYNI